MKAFYEHKIKNMIIFILNNVDYGAHFHDGVEIVVNPHGKFSVNIDNVKYEVNPNQILTVFPNQIHKYTDCTKEEYFLIIIKPSYISDLTNTFKTCIPKNPVIDMNETTKRLFRIIHHTYKSGTERSTKLLISAFLSLILDNQNFDKSNVQQPDTVHTVLKFCEDNYKTDINIAKVSDALHLNSSYVSHIFSDKLGISFRDYINGMRINYACELMQTTDLSVTEICYRCGFKSIRTFNRAFLKECTISPSEFKKKL